MTSPYIAVLNRLTGEWTAELVNGESVGPYLSLELLERDLERIAEHIAAGAWAGKAR